MHMFGEISLGWWLIRKMGFIGVIVHFGIGATLSMAQTYTELHDFDCGKQGLPGQTGQPGNFGRAC